MSARCGQPDLKVIGAAERISPDPALRGVTIDAAWQAFEEDSRGSMEQGRLADFAILSPARWRIPHGSRTSRCSRPPWEGRPSIRGEGNGPAHTPALPARQRLEIKPRSLNRFCQCAGRGPRAISPIIRASLVAAVCTACAAGGNHSGAEHVARDCPDQQQFDWTLPAHFESVAPLLCNDRGGRTTFAFDVDGRYTLESRH
ncbi:amidohydrolase family protein [Cupriavidus necator]|uniref:amidohydrolase family protein n=1 Tax=Cupriavidus necator TaxID=106590 RepID=UPI00339D97F4